MLSINDGGFLSDFKISEAAVGQIGHGYIGQAVEALFKPYCPVLVYDKAKPGLASLDEVVSGSQLIFIAVPTPMGPDGECHTGIVESVLADVSASTLRVGRDPREFIVVIKSTVFPGFTDRMIDRHRHLRIVFSPEFLTEKNSVEDFRTTTRVIIGGDITDARVVYKFFEGVWPDRMHPDAQDPVTIVKCEPKVAEMVKLFTNGLLMTRVLFANEIYQVCQKLDVEYDRVRELACFDPRVSPSHLMVPGPDGQFGAGGHCFPKDVNSLRYIAKLLGTGERLFTAVIERNSELREDKDWEKMKGRAVL